MKKLMSNTKLSITIDIEDWYHIPSVTGSPFSVYRNTNEFFENWNARYDFLSKPTERVLEILDEFDITATFFIVADIINNYPGLTESIIKRGHEIGCHGLHHSSAINQKTKKALLKPKEFEENTRNAKEMLEKKVGEKVIGYRAPNALIGKWMFKALDKLEFKYDSSINVNSFFNKTDFPLEQISTTPYTIENTNLTEFPFSHWDVLGCKIPTSGGPMLRFLGSTIILKGLKQSLKRGHTVFYFHPIDITDEKIPNIGRGRPFYWVIKGKKIEKRIVKIFKTLKNEGVQTECLGKTLQSYNENKGDL